MWDDLSKSNLRDLEKVKAIFLKKILCISKYSPSHLTYELASKSFFIEDLHTEQLLPHTEHYALLFLELQSKKKEISIDFYTTTAMMFTEWKEAYYELL